MRADRVAALPAEPPSIADWEDLLMRMELLPRVLRVTLEEVHAGEERVGAVLRAALDREAEVAGWLQRASGTAPDDRGVRPAGGDARSLAERIASLRARSFAMLQRRGLDVWAWTAALPGGESATAYQVVTALVRDDAGTLAALREGQRLGTGAC